MFILLLVLRLLYNREFESGSSEYLQKLQFHDLKFKNAIGFDKFFLQTLEFINSISLKILFNEPNFDLNIPLPIFNDPLFFIDTNFVWEESENYTFEVVKVYKKYK